MGIVKKGVVIGIDTCKAGFEDGDQFIIPSTKGGVEIFKNSAKQANVASVEKLMSVGNSKILNWDNEEVLIKHGLLYKMQEWAYEEEVSIVKNIRDAQFGYYFSTKTHAYINDQLWQRVLLQTRPIFIH